MAIGSREWYESNDRPWNCECGKRKRLHWNWTAGKGETTRHRLMPIPREYGGCRYAFHKHTETRERTGKGPPDPGGVDSDGGGA